MPSNGIRTRDPRNQATKTYALDLTASGILPQNPTRLYCKITWLTL
jgi:hypothetical protein